MKALKKSKGLLGWIRPVSYTHLRLKNEAIRESPGICSLNKKDQRI